MKMICTGGPYGDCCSSYDVELDHEYTVKEFVKEVLTQKPQEWGRVTLVSDFKYKYQHEEDTCQYKYGNIAERFSKEGTKERTILEVKAHGGWTAMDYFLKCK